MSLPTILFVGPAAVCVLAWLGPSILLPRRVFAGRGLLLEALTRVAAGSAALSLLTFVLGLAGVFERGVLIGITVALALPGLWVARLLLPRHLHLRDQPRPVFVLLALVGIALVLDLVAAAAPPTSADALRYHLGAPHWWLELGRIDDPFWDWHAFGPFGTEMLYAHGLALGGGETAGVLGAVLAALAVAAVFGLAREVGGGDLLAASLGAALFVLQGVVTWEATSSFVELALTFYAVLAAWCAVRYARTAGRGDALLAGSFAGAAAGTKYLGLVAGAVVLAGLALPALVRRRVLLLAGAAGLGVALAAAWYVRNAVATGNPFYPLLFGGKAWTHASQAELDLIDRSYGIRGSVARLPLLTFDLLAHGGRFDKGRYVGTAIFLLALLAPVARRSRTAVLLFAGAVFYLIGWWHLSEQARFLLPALAVLAAAGGAGAAGLVHRRPRAVLLVGALLAAATVVWAVSSVALTRQLLPVAVGAEGRAHFLQRLTGTYRAYRRVHALHPGTVALAGTGYLFPFNYPGRAIQLDVPAFASDVDGKAWLQQLRRLGAAEILAAGGADQVSQLQPVRSCLRATATFEARYVTSRSRGTSRPLRLRLYSTRSCGG